MREGYLKLFYLFLVVGGLFSCGTGKEEGKESPKIFRFNIHEGFTSMDPAFARNQSNIWVVNQLFNGLVELDQRMEVAPSLAKRWDISDDGRAYTFYLRTGIEFHEHPQFATGADGRPTRTVTAGDFVYSFKRILSPEVNSTGAWIFNDKVLRAEDGTVSDTCFKALNDSVFRVYLQQPFPAFLQVLTMPYAFVVPQEIAEHYQKDFRANPVGTGPFHFKYWEDNNSLVMTKNEHYWKTDDNGNPLPYLDAIKISFIEDKKVAFLSFIKGDLDFFSGLDENSKDMALNLNGTVKDKFKDQFLLEKIPYLNTEYLGFLVDDALENSKDHPLRNKKIRQAINYAIDREEIINFIRNGVGQPGHAGMIPSALPSFSSEAVKGYSYDPDKARMLLQEAGYPNGAGLPVLELYTQPNSQYQEMGELIVKHCDEVGIQVQLSINPFATHQEMVDNSKVNFFRGSWLGDYPDGENYLTLFYSKNFSPSGPNKTHFKSDAFDRLYEAAAATTDAEKRYTLYQKMDNLVMEEAPVVVLYYDEVIRFTQHHISGVNADPMNSLKLEGVDMKL